MHNVICMYVSTLFGAPIGALSGIYVSQMGYACIMIVCIYRRAGSTGSTIHVCIHACMHVQLYYVCMYVCTLFGAPIGAPGGIDVSQMGYACIMIACMYRHAGRTGSTMYVCIHARMHMYVCTLFGAARYSARPSARCLYVCVLCVCIYVCTLFDALIGESGGIYVPQMLCACIMIVCMYRHTGGTGSTIYVCTYIYSTPSTPGASIHTYNQNTCI